MNVKNETNALGEKHANDVPAFEPGGRQFSGDPEDRAMVTTGLNVLHRDLKGRHMQMIAM